MASANSSRAVAVIATICLATAAGSVHAQGPEEDPAAEPPPPVCPPPPLPPIAPKAPAEEHPRLIGEARAAVEELRYADALALLESIGPSDVAAIRAQTLEIAAVVHLIEGRSAKAQPLLEELYFMAPALLLDDPSLPPRVTKMFDEEASRPHKRAVELQLRPWGDDRRAFELTAGGATVRVDLACRGGAAGPLMPVQTTLVAGKARFRLPNLGRYGCHAVAVDRDGLPLGRFGTPAALAIVTSRPPPARPLPAPPAPAFYETWWFWTIAGSVVAGGVIATVVGLSDEQEVPDAEVSVELQPDLAVTILRW